MQRPGRTGSSRRGKRCGRRRSTPGGVEGLGVQEEETARVADHLVVPGAGMRELRERAKVDPAVEGIGPDTGEPSPMDNPDRFPPAEWPPKDEGQG